METNQRIVITERYSIDKLLNLCDSEGGGRNKTPHKQLDGFTYGDVIKSILHEIDGDGNLKVTYTIKPCGRLTPNYPSYAYIGGDSSGLYHRGYLAQEFYQDLDMSMSEANIIDQEMKRNSVTCYILNRYVKERERVLALFCGFGLNRQRCKDFFNFTLNGREWDTWEKEFVNEVSEINDKNSLKKMWNDLRQATLQLEEIKGKKTWEIYYPIETQIMLVVLEYFKQRKIETGGCIYDGLNVDKNYKIDLQELSNHVLSETGYITIWAIKEWKVVQGINKYAYPISRELAPLYILLRNKQMDYYSFIFDTNDYLDTKRKTTHQYKMSLANRHEHEQYQYTGERGIVFANPFLQWCKWKNRKSYETIDFFPSHDENLIGEYLHNSGQHFQPSQMYNLWTQYAYQPDGSGTDGIDIWLDHILKILCTDNEEHFKYMVNFLAHKLQFPWKKIQVSVLLLSEEGAGKGIIMKQMIKIMGEKYSCIVSSLIDAFGDWNDMLSGKLLVLLDEATWGGEKKMMGRIKNEITDDRRVIRERFKNGRIEGNFTDWISCSQEWMMDIQKGDRRHFCLHPDDKYAGVQTEESKNYFDKLGSVRTQSICNYLHSVNLKGWNPRAVPYTKAKKEHIEMSLDSVASWIYSCWKEGVVAGVNWEHSAIKITKSWIFLDYQKSTPHKLQVSQGVFWRRLRKILELTDHRPNKEERQVILPNHYDSKCQIDISLFGQSN